jgi:hypothetical protein
MAKEIIFTSIKYALGAMMITLTIASLWPWYIRSLETKEAAQSLPSIKAAGEAIKIYEADWGKLPPSKNWVASANLYNKVIEDPTYAALTGINQPENPGWGINGRLNLSIGEADDMPKTVKTSDFPEDAVLLAPSYFQAFYPQRNGVLPTQPLSKDNPTPTQHGLRLGSGKDREGISGLYLLLNGVVKQLSLDQAEKLLKIRPIPPSQRSEINLLIEERDTVSWEPKEGVEKFPNHIMLRRGEVTTPLIPTKGDDLSITFEATSETNTPFILSVEYYNQYKMPINVETKNGEPVFLARLTEIYGGGREIQTDKPVATKKNTEIAFNPSFGNAYPITKTKGTSKKEGDDQFYSTRIEKITPHFVKGTGVSLYKDYNQKYPEVATKDWKQYRKEIRISDAPEGTSLIGLKIINRTYSPILIREVKVKRD